MSLFDREPQDETLLDQTKVAVIPVLAETLHIHKTVADAGGVRIHKRVHVDTVTVDEPLLKQSVRITHVPIGREIAAPLPVRYEGDVTVIPVIEERLITVRQLFLVEEVHLTRIEQTVHEPQSITLRHEEAFVERQDMATGLWAAEHVALAAGAVGVDGARADAAARADDPAAVDEPAGDTAHQ